jgi:hypothetical protein
MRNKPVFLLSQLEVGARKQFSLEAELHVGVSPAGFPSQLCHVGDLGEVMSLL